MKRFTAKIQHLLCLLLLVPVAALARPVAQTFPVQSGSVTHSEVNDWLPGVFSNTFVDGSVIRLQDGQGSGEYVSAPLQAPFGINASVIQWTAAITADQALTLDVRSSVDGQNWGDWQRAQPQAPVAAGAMSQLFVLPPFTSFLQYRAGFTGASSSPTLDVIKLTYLNSTTGPKLAEIVGRVPLAGPATLTPAPQAVARNEWADDPAPAQAERQTPQRVEIDQIIAPVDDPNILATLRALRWVAQNIGAQPDLPYHYLIDGQGNLVEGRASVAQRIAGTNAGTVRIAVLADAQAEGVSEAAQVRLVDTLAWLRASYGIGSDAIMAAPNAPQRLKDAIAELQPTIAQSIIRSRTVFAEGTTADATERLSLFNPGTAEARATLYGFGADSEERRTVAVPPGQRIDVTLNGTLPLTGTLGLDVQADRPIFSERVLIRGRELLGSPGSATPSRTWYFGDGTTITDTTTTLAVVNPQGQEVAATLTLFPDGTQPVTRTTTFAPRSRVTLPLSELIPNATFGMKLVTSQPVVAERTVTLPGGAAHLATGVDQLSRDWYFAEGSTADATTTLVLLNPWPQQVAVTLQIMSEDGTSLSRRYAVPAQSRFALALNDIVPALPFALHVEAERPLSAERVMQINNGAVATASAGAPALATRWTFVEGSTAPPATTLLLVGNPNRVAVDLNVTYVLVNGQREQRTHTVPAMARLTISANVDVPDQPIVTSIVTSNRPIIAERSIYVDGADGRGGETSVGVAGK